LITQRSGDRGGTEKKMIFASLKWDNTEERRSRVSQRKEGCSESDCNGRDILLNCGNIDRKLNFNLSKQ